MRKTILSVSLLYGEMKVLVVERGIVRKQWECADPVKDLDGLRRALTEVLRVTGFSGRYVSFVVEDTFFVHQFLQIPAMKTKDLKVFLARKADQIKTFEGPAAFAYRRTCTRKGGEGVLLDVLPKTYVDELIRLCQDLRLTPVRLTRLTGILARHLRELPIRKGDVAGLAAEVAGKTVLVVGTSDGEVLFDRYLGCSWAEDQEIERVGREMTRSVLFAKQQFTVAVGDVWLMGGRAEQHTEQLRQHLDAVVKTSPVHPDGFYWARAAVKLPVRDDSNFIPVEIQKAVLQQVMTGVTVAAVIALVISVVGAVAAVEVLIQRAQSGSQTSSTQTVSLEAEKEAWNRRFVELDRQKQFAHAVVEEWEPPLPGWFLGYLGDALPDELVLSKASLGRDDHGWAVQLVGNAPRAMTQSAVLLQSLEDRLKDGPYHLTITRSWREKWREQLKHGHEGEKDVVTRGFAVEAGIR